MMINMDYDKTYALDPDGWDAVMAFMRTRGHDFVCITGRAEPPARSDRQIPARVICAPNQLKSYAAMKAGIKVDVWIDDEPGQIEPCRILSFDDLAPGLAPQHDCECHRCIREKNLTVDWGNGFTMPLSSSKMILCPTCGNKRCPHASDHDLECTKSNAPGQPGSIYK